MFVFISVVLRHYFPPQAKMADFISHTVQHPTEGTQNSVEIKQYLTALTAETWVDGDSLLFNPSLPIKQT